MIKMLPATNRRIQPRTSPQARSAPSRLRIEGYPVRVTAAAVMPHHGEAVEPERAHDLDLIDGHDALSVVHMTRAARVGSTQPGPAPRAHVACVQIVAVDCVWPRAGPSLSACRNSNSHLKHATFSVLPSRRLADAPYQRDSPPNSRVQFLSCPASRMPNWLAS